MSRAVRVVSMLLLGFALSGCTVAATTTTVPTSKTTSQPSVGVEAAEAGSDVGNNRPQVSYDGLMVRRRVVIAIHPTASADLTSLRKELDLAATRLHTTLSTISLSVLDPAVLEGLSPQLAVALPAGETLADARRLIDPAPAKGRAFPEVAEYKVASVLVHDLRFTAHSANPARLAKDIAREGILSDALGNYTTTMGRRELDITYTGPLLSDDLVTSVRGGIARRAGIEPAAVSVSPRSVTGVGVDMAKEPAPAPAVVAVSTAHQHSSALPAPSSAPPAPSASLFSTTQIVSAIALMALLILALTLPMTRRIKAREGKGHSHSPL